LQAAIQGKLTEQLVEDGCAENEIIKLFGNDYIKINDYPFDIPKNWIWTRMGIIGDTNIGLTYKPSEKSINGTLVLRSSNILNNRYYF
jgi:type I restriction enzyme S subunit